MRIGCFLALLLFGCLVDIAKAGACVPAPTSLYTLYTDHQKVFVATVAGEVDRDKGIYNLLIDEVFKGNLTSSIHQKLALPVSFVTTMECGLGMLKTGDHVLVFMNEGQKASTSTGSFVIWREADMKEPVLNPMMDSIVLMRQMLFGEKAILEIAPDEDTALHLALKALLPIFGKDAVAKNWPFKVVFRGNPLKYEENVWHVEGRAHCPDSTKACYAGVLSVDIHKTTGDVVRISSGD